MKLTPSFPVIIYRNIDWSPHCFCKSCKASVKKGLTSSINSDPVYRYIFKHNVLLTQLYFDQRFNEQVFPDKMAALSHIIF